MAPAMSTVERLKVKNELNRILKKQLSSITQRTILQKLGIYSNCHGSALDFDACEDSVLLQLRKELQNLVVGSNGDAATDPVCEDDEAEKKKVLRVAMLNTRFAETIKKANGGKSDDQWEKLKKQRREEEARIKQELIRKQKLEKEDYELKKRKRETEDDELKKRMRQEQINKERQAARLALELVEKNVDVVDNIKVMKELAKLMNGTLEYDPKMAEIRREEFIRRMQRDRELEELQSKKRRRQEQINQARKAARIALELVEKKIDVVDNFKVMKELKMLMNGTACF